jgi:hypothetical protein
MEIDREKVKAVLKEQAQIAETKRGMQPEMILSCFYGKGVNDDSICRGCRNYDGCYLTLRTCIIERKPFERG